MALSGSINFLSASLTGSDNINVDFLGLNTLIIDAVSGSSNKLGAPSGALSTEYFNTAVENQGDPTKPNQLNSILLNRNGPYQHASWKQTRGAEHPVARHLRMNNTMSVDARDFDPLLREERKRNERNRLEDIRPNQHPYSFFKDPATGEITEAEYIIDSSNLTNPGVAQQLEQFYVPVVTSKHKPLVYTVVQSGTPSMKVRASFMNRMMDFSSEELNARLKFASGDPSTGSFDEPGKQIAFKSSNFKTHKIIEMAKNYSGRQFIYSETIFPKEINSYKDYKLERPSYEQSAGLDGYDSATPRLFWKNNQGGNSTSATSDGTTRLRTDGIALNSLNVPQQTAFSRPYDATNFAVARQLISSSARSAGASDGQFSFVSAAFARVQIPTHGLESPRGTASFGVNFATTSFDLGLQGLIVEYINNGVVVNRYQADANNNLPLPGFDSHISGVLFQLDAYQPYQPSLLSAWPLDSRNDIYSKPPYLTSSIGGKGLQIGLTPHRNQDLADSSTEHHEYLQVSGTAAMQITASIINAVSNLQTASAGELSYSTKPTIFFWRGDSGAQEESLYVDHVVGGVYSPTSSMSFVGASASTTIADLLDNTGRPTDKFELQDAQGNRVAFAFNADVTTANGSTMNVSGSTFVIVGINGLATGTANGFRDFLAQIAQAVNFVNSNTSNGLTLNIIAKQSAEAGTSRRCLVFSQTTPGDGPSILYDDVSTVYAGTHGQANITGPKFMFGDNSAFELYAGDATEKAGGVDTTLGPRFASLAQTAIGPPMTKYKPSLLGDGVMGYIAPTASLQYNRHTFPYNSPFYATSRIRGKNPFYNSYNDSVDDLLKYFGRDYSIFSEFRYSENIEFYNRTFNATSNEILYAVTPNTYINQTTQCKKIIRSADILNLNTLDIHKADSRTIEGGRLTSSADVETYNTSSTRYRYNDINRAVLATTNALVKRSFLSDLTATQYDYEHEQTDSMKNFSFTLDPLTSGYTNKENTVPDRIRFNANIIKKLIPYNGFYPVARTTQIGSAFINDITGAFGFSGSLGSSSIVQEENPRGRGFTAGQYAQDPARGAAFAQTLIEPFMGPGLLYNSIKSGVAVDYPMYNKSPNYFFPRDLSDSELNNNGLPSASIFTTYHGGLYMMGASRCMPSILTSMHDKRLPFEALYNVNKFREILSPSQGQRPEVHLVSDFIDLDRAQASTQATYPGKATSGSIEWMSPRIKLPLAGAFNSIARGEYFSMINNYLSETMEFFLADLGNGSKLPVAATSFVNPESPLKAENEYKFEVSLKQGKYNIMCEGPRNAGIGNPDGAFEETGTNDGYFMRNSSMRGYIYGPPLEIVAMTDRVSTTDFPVYANSNHDFKDIFTHAGDYKNYLAANLQDPAYHAYTPPYFYGKSSVVYRVTPFEDISFSTENLVKQLTNPDASTADRTYYVDEYVLPTSGSNKSVSGLIVDEDSLNICLPTTGSVSNGSTARMSINSSARTSGKLIQIKRSISPGSDVSPVVTDNIWTIYPEWVCPVLDFSGSFSAYREKFVSNDPVNNFNLSFDTKLNIVENTFHDRTTGRGMWGGYGTDPYDEELMTLALSRNGINDLSTQQTYINEKGIYFSVNEFITTSDVTENQTLTSEFILDTDLEKYSSIVDTAILQDSDTLLDRLGLEKKRYPVGKFADSKNITEAILLIPYLDKEVSLRTSKFAEYRGGQVFDVNRIYQTREIIPGKHFLPIHERVFENILNLFMVEEVLGEKLSTQLEIFGTTGDQFSLDAAAAAGAPDPSEYLRAARQEAIGNTDIGKLISRISCHAKNGGFMIPPEFDFVHNKNIPPFQMFVVPFDETLDKQDLIDIYQGLMPEASLHIQKDSSFAEANVKFNPFYKDLYVSDYAQPFATAGITNFLSPQLFLDQKIRDINYVNGNTIGKLVLSEKSVNSSLPDNSIIPYDSAREFYRNLRFMVFKVKQRAKKDYTNYKLSQIYNAAEQKVASIEGDSEIENTLERQRTLFKTPRDVYGSNWPYDHFSLIESGKIDVEIEVSG